MQRLGMILLVVGAGVLIGYAAYALVKELFEEDVPVPVVVGIVVAAVGLLLLVVGVGYERWRARRTEDLDEVEP